MLLHFLSFFASRISNKGVSYVGDFFKRRVIQGNVLVLFQFFFQEMFDHKFVQIFLKNIVRVIWQ